MYARHHFMYFPQVHDTIKTLRLQILSGRFTHCGPTWRYRGVNSPFARLYLVTGGEGRVRHSGRSYRLVPRSLTVTPAHTTAEYSCKKAMDLHWVHFNASVSGTAAFFDLFDHRQTMVDDPSEAARVFRRMLTCHARSDTASRLEADGSLRILLAHFLRGHEAVRLEERSRALARFEPVLRYIQEHLDEQLDTPRLAALLHLQPTYFANLFSRHMGVAPAAYVRRRRVERVRERLWYSRDTLATLADELGFSDAFHLSKTFKNLTGMSPRQFRMQDREAV